ncbi:MAG: electron transfer flavoprotein subunit beta/FixA family protein [Victivallales bacterium]|jgi:electron transfer flavoprotein beta subunit|nr:electron transfer flavoprotein subunit beta/FixA family protein [Victivallales bacterium]MBT7164341.1 electron transfer flavoprotein subunit beta/FixA family protein [Victivallales bacterium]
MNIAVCLKQVPDTADLKLDPVHNTLIREGVDSVLNPLDEFPLEAALRLREQAGGAVVAFTMGPPQAKRVLEKAVAMGADDGVLVSDRAFAGADTWATSLTLARALPSRGPFDVVLCGKQAIDGDTAQVGPGIAAHLGWSQVTYVTSLEMKDGALVLERMLDAGKAVLRVRLPVVLTVLKEANEPRLPSLAGRLRAFRMGSTVLGAADLGLATNTVGLDGSPTRVARIAVPSHDRGLTRLEGDSKDVARQFVSSLRDRGVLAGVAATGPADA